MTQEFDLEQYKKRKEKIFSKLNKASPYLYVCAAGQIIGVIAGMEPLMLSGFVVGSLVIVYHIVLLVSLKKLTMQAEQHYAKSKIADELKKRLAALVNPCGHVECTTKTCMWK